MNMHVAWLGLIIMIRSAAAAISLVSKLGYRNWKMIARAMVSLLGLK